MVYDAEQLSELLTIGGKKLTPRTIRRRAANKTLPSYIICHKFKSYWIFEIQEIPEHLRKNFEVMLKPKKVK
jgi:hypothetical protein